MQGIYTYIPETNHVSREYSVSAIVITIYGAYIASSHCTFTLALSEVCVQFTIWQFSVVPSFHGFLVCCSRIF